MWHGIVNLYPNRFVTAVVDLEIQNKDRFFHVNRDQQIFNDNRYRINDAGWCKLVKTKVSDIRNKFKVLKLLFFLSC